MTRASLGALALVGLLASAGCATKADINALREDVMRANETADAARQAAQAAERRAAQAEAAANAAAEKADRVYRESLRK